MHRIRFANQLRGLAALGVACSHLIGVYWVFPAVVTAATASSPPLPQALPGLFWLVGHPWFNLGPFGVGVFFLISGLVIPISLGTHSRLSFLGARLLRIFPTYVACLLLLVGVIALNAAGWGRPFPYRIGDVVGNALLGYDLVGRPSIDLVNWTLSIELKFYVLVVLLAPWIRRGSVLALLGVGVAVFACDRLIAAGVLGPADPAPSTPGYTASSHLLCLTFMLMGTAFNYHLRGLVRTRTLLAVLAALAGLFVLTWRTSVWAVQFPVVTVNYAYALALFGGLYAVRRHIPANPVLDAMAAISFPFYVLHSILGFSVMRLLMTGAGWPYYPALAAAVLTILAAATLIHRAVERPTIRVGRHLAPRRPVSEASPTRDRGVTDFEASSASRFPGQS